jgi:hypothetical protein
MDALRLLAALIADDIRAGSPALAAPVAVANVPARRHGRPKSAPYAVAAVPLPLAA